MSSTTETDGRRVVRECQERTGIDLAADSWPNDLVDRIDAALRQRELEVRAEESAWLVEKGPEGIGKVLYICANYMLEWTDDPNKALRLSRREDAEAICSIVEDADRVAEYEWPAIRRDSEVQEGGKSG